MENEAADRAFGIAFEGDRDPGVVFASCLGGGFLARQRSSLDGNCRRASNCRDFADRRFCGDLFPVP